MNRFEGRMAGGYFNLMKKSRYSQICDYDNQNNHYQKCEQVYHFDVRLQFFLFISNINRKIISTKMLENLKIIILK